MVGEHLRVRGADDGAVREPEVGELRVTERDADRLEVARDVARADLSRVHADPLGAPAREPAVVGVCASSCSALSGPAARAPQVEVRVVDAVDGPRRPVPRGSQLTRSKRSFTDCGSRPYMPQVADTRLAGTAVVHHQRPDPLVGSCGRMAREGTASVDGRRPVDGHGERPALEAVAAVGPHGRASTRGAAASSSWAVVVVVVVDGAGLALPARRRGRWQHDRQEQAGRSATGGLTARRDRPGAGQAELPGVEDAVRVERGLGRDRARRGRRRAPRARAGPG